MDDAVVMLTPSEVGRMLHVHRKTITRWAREGKLTAVRTPGGRRRYPLTVVRALLERMGYDEQSAMDAIRAVR